MIIKYVKWTFFLKKVIRGSYCVSYFKFYPYVLIFHYLYLFIILPICYVEFISKHRFVIKKCHDVQLVKYLKNKTDNKVKKKNQCNNCNIYEKVNFK
jgi:hypothetical protein